MSISTRSRWLSSTDLLFAAVILSSVACYRPLRVAGHTDVARQAAAVEPSTGEGRVRRFAGVDLVPTGPSGFAIRIHSRMVGNGDPLYVIDGTLVRIPANRGIDWLKPEDIAQIKVLKYLHEIAEYGPDGVNGVIVITTKLAAGQ